MSIETTERMADGYPSKEPERGRESSEGAIAKWAKKWAQGIYNRNEDPLDDEFYYRDNTLPSDEEIFDYLQTAAKKESASTWAPKRDNGNLRVAEATFLEGLTEYIEETNLEMAENGRVDIDDAERFERFLTRIARRLFDFHFKTGEATILDDIPLASQLDFSARITRIPEAESRLGLYCTESIIKRLRFLVPPVLPQTEGRSTIHFPPDYEREEKRIRTQVTQERQELIKRVARAEIPERMDIIHELQTIGVIAANDDDLDVRAAGGVVVDIIRDIGREEKSPLGQYAAEGAVEWIGDELRERSGWTFTQAEEAHVGGGRVFARLPDDLAAKSDVLKQGISFVLDGTAEDSPGVFQSKPLRVARDAIAILDHSNTPQEIAVLGPAKIDALERGETIEQEDLRFESYEYGIAFNPRMFPFRGTAERGVEEISPLPEDDLLLLRRLHEPVIRKRIEEDLCLSLDAISIYSQVHLLRFLAGQDRAGFSRMRDALRGKPEIAGTILESFFACAEDKKYGEVILSLAEQLEPDVAKAVFAKYAEIASTSEKVGTYLAENVARSDRYGGRERRSIVRGLIHRANELLVDSQATAGHDPQAIISRLEAMNADIILFGSVFKEVAKTDGFELQDIREAQIFTASSQEIAPEDRDAAIAIFRRNHETHPPELFNAEMEEFLEATRNPNDRFYILKAKDAMVAFVRFEDMENGNLYAGSFNVDPVVQRSAIGRAFLHVAMDKENETRIIEAAVDADNLKLIDVYQREFLLNPAGEETFGGHRYLKLMRPRQARGTFASSPDIGMAA